ncbi:MAG TPA: protein-L-isoaspartate(D-aspartate) O-methyltransferase [Candidatus Ozemobacteraceae bacterium]
MVRVLRAYGIRDARVLAAMGRIPREAFIPEGVCVDDVYGDHPLPIGHGQTISQPYIVAYMTELVEAAPGRKILEIGTGSGYQAAVLAELGASVFSLEMVPELVKHARAVLQARGYAVTVRLGDGYEGWPEEAPFDAIIGTCAADEIPITLCRQLVIGGQLVLPIGGVDQQRIVIIRRDVTGFTRTEDLPVRFVPMVHAGHRGTGRG